MRETIGYLLIGLVVASWILFFIVRARRRRVPRAYPPFPTTPGGVPTIPPTPAPLRDLGQPRDIGWHPDPDHMSEQVYWDGRSWTARRRWNGESWIES